MTFNADTLYGATRPTMHVPGREILRQLNEEARGRALDAFTAALVRADAAELADELADSLAAAEQAAVEPEAALADAKKALDKAEHSALVAIRAYIDRKIDNAVKPGESEPPRESAKVLELKAAVAAADQAAAPFTKLAAYHREQIRTLRDAPKADPATLAVIAEALCGCHVDAPVNGSSMTTAQPAQSTAMVGVTS